MPRSRSLSCGMAVLAAGVVAFAAPTAAFAGGDSHPTPAVSAIAGYVTTVTFDVITVESSVAGGDWADSTYHMVASIYDLGSGQYRFDLSASGSFRSWAANSPNGTGTIEEDVTGTVAGGASLVLSGPPLPDLASYLGSFDMGCDHVGDCVGSGLDALEWIFGSYDLVRLDSYSVAYSTCDGRVAVQQSEEPELIGDITGGPAACDTSLRMAFDGLYAFINPGYNAPAGVEDGVISPHDVCYVISSNGRPSGARLAAICDIQWPGGARPGWSNGAVLLTGGPVYDDGTDSGYWAGDPVVAAFSPNAARLPLHRTDGAWSYLYKEHCHHMSGTGEPLAWCR
jgi:hypothetical protein